VGTLVTDHRQLLEGKTIAVRSELEDAGGGHVRQPHPVRYHEDDIFARGPLNNLASVWVAAMETVSVIARTQMDTF
jgi:hypothetical protein